MTPNDGEPDLSLVIGGVRFRNPVIAASGTFGYGREYQGLLTVSDLGGICTKGLTLEARDGNRGTRLHETPAGLMNSVGLENPGIPAFLERELAGMLALGPVVIVNLAGSTIESYAEGARLLDSSGAAMVELNISCPNVKAGGMAFGLDPQSAGAVTRAVRRALPHKPLMVKLSPNAPDLPAVARACVSNGADALSLVNTFKALALDVEARRPVFENLTAGLSGPAVRPLALRLLWELWDAVAVPLVGLGGIGSPEDALEFLLAGAAAVQVGSALFPRPALPTEIIRGIAAYMRRKGFSSLTDLPLRQQPPAV
ncbi:MAG: dihydroorotate dehydrogenase [Spirochaetaceae bacterium]|nr:dihydroorotate dehydrogenase [Spirochaetaceae bacterium]